MPRLIHQREIGSLADLVRDRERSFPSELAYAYVSNDGSLSHRLTYGDLIRRVRSVQYVLQQAGCGPGDRAALLYPTGPEFIAAFLACTCSGIVAVPIDMPTRRTTATVNTIIADSGARVVLTDNHSIPIIRRMLETWPTYTRPGLAETTSGSRYCDSEDLETASISRESLAYLQYSSGSTGSPAGVMITHGNALANLAYIDHVQLTDSETASVTWLPHFHDMGLVEGLLQPLYSGHPCYVISPAHFVHRPAIWLQTISRYRATHTGGPNFAYDMCNTRVTDEEAAALDLSSLRLMYNGAEPIRVATLETFHLRFASCGLRKDALTPVYGLAEATLMVACSPIRIPARSLDLDSTLLALGKIAAPSESGRSCRISESGSITSHVPVQIADPATGQVSHPDSVGEIWIAGPSVTSGYWQNPRKTAETTAVLIDDGSPRRFLRTGDLGFIRDGALYVTGRLKDLIIIRGRNLYPQDIERSAFSSHESLAADGAAAFGIETAQGERLVVVQEIQRTARHDDPTPVILAIRQAIAREFDVACWAVVLIRPTTLPRTSSGKVKRRECRSAFLDRQLDVVASWQSANE